MMRTREKIFGSGRKPASFPSTLVIVPEGPRPPRTPVPVWVGVEPVELEAEPGLCVEFPVPGVLLLPDELQNKKNDKVKYQIES